MYRQIPSPNYYFLAAPSQPLSAPVPSILPPLSGLATSGYKAPKIPQAGSKIYVASEQASEKFETDEIFIRGGSIVRLVEEYKTSFEGLPSDKTRPRVMLFLDPSTVFSNGCEWEPSSVVYYESPDKAEEVKRFFRKI
jgi:hypothetical protein